MVHNGGAGHRKVKLLCQASSGQTVIFLPFHWSSCVLVPLLAVGRLHLCSVRRVEGSGVHISG